MRFAQVAELLYTLEGCCEGLYHCDGLLMISLIEQPGNCANDNAPSYHVDDARKKLHVALQPHVSVYNEVTS